MINNKIRLDYLDVAKGIAIILVVLGHIYDDNNYIKIWLYSFHIPIFFIISGCLLRNKYDNSCEINIMRFIKYRIKTLLIPYIFLSILSIIVGIIINGLSGKKIILNFIYLFTLFGVGPMWFLAALFIAEVMFIYIRKVTSKTSI